MEDAKELTSVEMALVSKTLASTFGHGAFPLIEVLAPRPDMTDVVRFEGKRWHGGYGIVLDNGVRLYRRAASKAPWGVNYTADIDDRVQQTVGAAWPGFTGRATYQTFGSAILAAAVRLTLLRAHHALYNSNVNPVGDIYPQ